MAKRELPKRLPPTAKEFCNLFDALDSNIHSLRLLLADIVELETDRTKLLNIQILMSEPKEKPKPGRKSSPPEPTATEPTATEPTATEPTATEPTATEPTATEPTATEPTATEPAATEPAKTRKRKRKGELAAQVETPPIEIATSESNFPEIVIACSGRCGKTTEGMSFETKSGLFQQTDDSTLPTWTCPDCQVPPVETEPEATGPVEKLGTDL